MLSTRMAFTAVALVSVGLSGCEKQVSYSADIQPILDNSALSVTRMPAKAKPPAVSPSTTTRQSCKERSWDRSL